MTTEVIGEKIQSEKFLIFLLNEESYGFPILKIDGIIGLPSITPMPKTPDYVKGVINLRGQIIPVIDLRLALSMDETDYNEQTCIIVVKIFDNKGEKFIGFIVDIVSEVLDIAISDIEKPPLSDTSINGDFLRGIGKAKDKVIMLLNLEKIIHIQETINLLNNDADVVSDLDSLVNN